MESILITGANGEVGHGLIVELSRKNKNIIALDISELDKKLKPLVRKTVKGDVLDASLVKKLLIKYNVATIFHLAAILSTGGEKNPRYAHEVNVGGTSLLLETVNEIARNEAKTIKFVFPSTVAIYGLPDLETKRKKKPLKEEEYNTPITMYGINKLYCEQLGIYYSKYFKLLEARPKKPLIDFRSVRFPGIISALTVPSGGTSDYAPEMIHAAAQGKSYSSFVRPDTTIPFMVMPDAIKALLTLSKAPRKKLTRSVYNVSSFSVSAKKISELVESVFPESTIDYNPDLNRQKIVDSWPIDIDDSRARIDWNWNPDYDFQKAFNLYLIPEIKKRYQTPNKN